MAKSKFADVSFSGNCVYLCASVVDKRNPIIVALDVPTAEAALKLVEQLAPVSGGFKVGSELVHQSPDRTSCAGFANGARWCSWI